MATARPIERKFTEIERAFGIHTSSGRIPGTSLSRALLPTEQGGGLGWCLAVGRMEMPKIFFYSKSIVGAFAKARNAARKGHIEPPTTPLIG